jgi:hypothetical protein
MIQNQDGLGDTSGVSVEWDGAEQDRQVDSELRGFADCYDFDDITDFEFAARALGRYVEAVGSTQRIETAASIVDQRMEEWLDDQPEPQEDSWRRVLNRTDISSSATAILRDVSNASPWGRQEEHSNDPAAKAVRELMNDGNMMERADDDEILRRLVRKVMEMDEKLNRLDKSRSNVDVMEAYCDGDY